MMIRFEENVSIENAQHVCQWSNSLGKSFQEQWMGTMIPFPLTIQILQDLEGIFSIFDGQELDLVDIIEQTLDFKIPASVLCKEDCKGFCQGCGANLNIEACSCNESANDEEIIDPRFAKLKDIFKND